MDTAAVNNPRVSVIVPNYNHARFLHKRIQTILDQSYQNFELILLDDCSTDESKSILESYQSNPKVSHVIYNEHNSGSPFNQWTKGVALAKGEWIWIAESDDYASPDLLQRLLDAALNTTNCGLAYSDSQAIDNNGEIIEGYLFSEAKNKSFNNTYWSSDYSNSGIRELEDYMLIGGTINNTSAVLFKSSLLKSGTLFDFPFRYIGDKFIFVKVLVEANIAYVNAPLNFYRIDLNSNSFEKHHLKYCLEQFQIFYWIYSRNIAMDKRKLKKAFNKILSVSFYKNWSLEKAKVFLEMFSISPVLFTRMAIYNITNPFKRKN